MDVVHFAIAVASGGGGAALTTVFSKRTFSVVRHPNGATVLPFTPASSPMSPAPAPEMNEAVGEALRLCIAILDAPTCVMKCPDPLDFAKAEREESDLPAEVLRMLDMQNAPASVRVFSAGELPAWLVVRKVYNLHQGAAWTLKPPPGHPPRPIHHRHHPPIDAAFDRFSLKDTARRLAAAEKAERDFVALAKATLPTSECPSI